MNTTRELQNALTAFSLPLYPEIPDVGLYLDQVVKFINSYLADFPEMTVTNSMISNYAKQKLIDRVNKKTYTREQIAILIYIVMTKTVLSIENIKLTLENAKKSGDSFEPRYIAFRENLVTALSGFYEREKTLPLNQTHAESDLMTENVVIAIAYKMYLERYFEIFKEKQKSEDKAGH